MFGLPHSRGTPQQAYTRLAVLPEEDGHRRYRIKSLIEPYERVASEHELGEA
jgi:hypothetical protein